MFPVCAMTPETVEYAENNYWNTTKYLEGDEITYTCLHDPYLTTTVTCDENGNWDDPDNFHCPASRFIFYSSKLHTYNVYFWLLIFITGCSDPPIGVQYSDSDYAIGRMYIENNTITYTCVNDDSLMETLTCNGDGDWDVPALHCPSSNDSNIVKWAKKYF